MKHNPCNKNLNKGEYFTINSTESFNLWTFLFKYHHFFVQ